jgi:hypothetical protein
MKHARLVVTLLLIQAHAAAQNASAPQVLGRLAGPGATPSQPGLKFYGTDSGWTFVHRGKLQILFGDTWSSSHTPCDPPAFNDDSQATLPLLNPGGVPPLTFETQASSPTDLARIQVFRGSESLSMGFGQVPLTGFSDGRVAAAAFGRQDFVRCAGTPAACPSGSGLTCTQDVGECQPAFLNIPVLCDATTGGGCLQGQACTPTTGFCIDPKSSQNDGTTAGERFIVAHKIDIGIQRPSAPVVYDSGVAMPTNKFINMTTRTVKKFTLDDEGNDYTPGSDYLLAWGRPGFFGEQGRQDQLYLMVQKLPLKVDAHGQIDFHPRYFAGLDGGRDPKWSNFPGDAAPLSLDGTVGGSPHEALPIVDQMAVSFLPAPINKWVMLYGGDVPDILLVDPGNDRPGPTPGAIMMRFASNPWGPWSPPVAHLSPGSPFVPGDPYGPGGFLFHYACTDQAGMTCARTDPTRPLDVFNPGCAPPPFPFDIGRLYAVNIIDAYTRRNSEGGLDVFWNVSTWNPYGVMLMKTAVNP